MKHFLLLLILVSQLEASAQITTPVIRANFGVDADLRANYFNGFFQAGNDDWFNNGTSGPGEFMIDTTGAAAVVARYLVDIPFRRLPFYRTMRFAPFTVVNNRLVLDAVMIRDYHGDDSTVFASGSSKNGMSPQNWNCPVSQNIPDKNDILDMFVHVRRAGPTTSTTDSLWLFGGLSLDNITGNRYVDFEMYQTDIYYDRTSRQFYNYGPDEGHTTWEFDAAGNITKPGDIIFTAEYQSASLTFVEARIWIHISSLALTPAAFAWSGQFDGASASAEYGYASIQPKIAGTYYTGLQCGNNTWGGPFGIILQNDNYVTNYTARQFVEFSVNLTKLGLDPVTLLGGNSCGMPFRRILVKTRASASFTAELKDFVGPFDFFLTPRVTIATDVPMICDTGSISQIWVTNPVATSVYNWSTPNGNIVGSTTGTSIIVDTPGTYIVTQHLQANCPAYASDTIVIGRFPICDVLEDNLFDFTATLVNPQVSLSWKVLNKQVVRYFDLERSTDGMNFKATYRVNVQLSDDPTAAYHYTDNVSYLTGRSVYYRLRMKDISTREKFSDVIRLQVPAVTKNRVIILPNPGRDLLQVRIASINNSKVGIHIYDQAGKMVAIVNTFVKKGNNLITLYQLVDKPMGIYHAVISLENEVFRKKLLMVR